MRLISRPKLMVMGQAPDHTRTGEAEDERGRWGLSCRGGGRWSLDFPVGPPVWRGFLAWLVLGRSEGSYPGVWWGSGSPQW